MIRLGRVIAKGTADHDRAGRRPAIRMVDTSTTAGARLSAAMPWIPFARVVFAPVWHSTVGSWLQVGHCAGVVRARTYR